MDFRSIVNASYVSGTLSKLPAWLVKASELVEVSSVDVSTLGRLTAAGTICLVNEHRQEFLEVIDLSGYYCSVYVDQDIQFHLH